MTDKLPAYGFLGLGDSEETNVELQLDNFMPEDVGDMITPKLRQAGPGVKKIAAWLEDAFNTEVTQVADVIDSLATRAASGTDVTLVMVLGDPLDDADVALVCRAVEAGIKVRSINHAMDEVEKSDVVTEPPPSEPERPAAARTRAPRGSKTSAAPEPSEGSSAAPAPRRRGRPRNPEPDEVVETPDPPAAVQAPVFWQGTGPELLALIDERVKLALQHITLSIDTPPF